MHAKDIVAKFGTQTAVAAMLGINQSSVAHWIKTGVVPAKWHSTLLACATERGIELGAGDFVATPARRKPATPVSNEINGLVAVMPAPPATGGGTQMQLGLGIEHFKEIDGVGMGVLSDGTPFLTGRGLARLCGVAHSVVQDISEEWTPDQQTPRATRLREILTSHGIAVGGAPFIPIQQRSGVFYAYTDDVCLAILEYYSFDAGPNIREEAQRNYRLLAGKALRDLIYTQVGYDPSKKLPERWRQFHDRVSLTYNSVPAGFFGIFKEMADMIVTLGQAGLHIDSNFVPDISVGQHWATHWRNSNFDQVYGERIKFEHNYPSYFPQAKSNPQEPWCYPEMALGEFRRWLREAYIGDGKFKNYLDAKVKERALPISFAQLAIASYVRD